jgi:hypothetical protein
MNYPSVATKQTPTQTLTRKQTWSNVRICRMRAVWPDGDGGAAPPAWEGSRSRVTFSRLQLHPAVVD